MYRYSDCVLISVLLSYEFYSYYIILDNLLPLSDRINYFICLYHNNNCIMIIILGVLLSSFVLYSFINIPLWCVNVLKLRKIKYNYNCSALASVT